MPLTKLTSIACAPGVAETETTAGRVRGMIRNGIYTYRGIKYADAERFTAPKPVQPWTGVKTALQYGPICPSLNYGKLPPEGNLLNSEIYYPQDENCQYLNIWSPTEDRNAKKPVMVWIHGGGGSFGSCITFDGESMSGYGDVVVVSLNHRLNCIAMLDFSAYDDAFKDSANLSYLDIIAALKWVRDNIAEFGGDPGNVTIFGHSGGGGKCLNLMQMPAADGLYHKVILMAGVLPEERMYPTIEFSRAVAARTLELLGIPPEDCRKLQAVPYDTLAVNALAAMRELAIPFDYRATWSQCTSDFFLGHPFDAGLRPEAAKIPMFIGSAAGERNFSVGRWNSDPLLATNKNLWTEAECERALRSWFGDKLEAVREEYPKAYPERKLVDAIYTDMGHRASIMKLCEMRAEVGGADTYMYLFNLEFPINNGTVAWHGAEMNFAFHNADYYEATYIPGITERLQDEMCGCWTTFARSGNPNHPGIPHLAPFSHEAYSTIIWDKKTTVAVNHDRKLSEILPRLTLPNDPNGYPNG